MLPPGGRPHPPTPARVPSTGRAGRRLWIRLPEPAFPRVPSPPSPQVTATERSQGLSGAGPHSGFSPLWGGG